MKISVPSDWYSLLMGCTPEELRSSIRFGDYRVRLPSPHYSTWIYKMGTNPVGEKPAFYILGDLRIRRRRMCLIHKVEIYIKVLVV